MHGGPRSARHPVVAVFVGFAAFGAFWGVWGASIPRIQEQAGVSDAQLGLALLFVGAGALPAMLLSGRALDRWGLRVAAPAIGVLGAVGAALSLTAVDPVSLSVGLALVGVSSGAVDVTINAAAGRVEATVRGPVITRAHGVFSSAVVLASVATGLAAGRSLSVTVPFLGVGVICLAAGVHLSRALARLGRPAREPLGVRSPRPRTDLAPLVLIGALGALAFATENAHQSWSAVFAHRELQAGPGSAAVAPAVFAATVAITRFSVGGVGAAAARTVLLVGAAAAAAGALVIAAAPNLLVAVGGLVLAAGGTAVQFPTLLGIVSRDVEESRRGRATSVVTTVAYLGFLLGPVYVGLWADGVGLRGAMLAVAGLGLLLLVLTPTLLRLAQRAPGPIGPSQAPGR